MVIRSRPVRRIASHPHGCRAFTLIEVLIALALLGAAVIAVTQAVTAGQMQSHAALHRAHATMLAEAMIEEILSKPYGDPQPPLGSSGPRGDFQEIGDYHGFEESPGEIADHAGRDYPEAFQSFTRIVTVEPQTRTVPLLGDRDGLLVTVTVADDRQGVWTVTRFVPEPGP